ncbi:MAG: Rieske 2Fe-2S domain-containing protein [Trueperaceae bacterium]|nr:Rieske 2Fe-2S domain-containing protein [Trueperaceae bacterium]
MNSDGEGGGVLEGEHAATAGSDAAALVPVQLADGLYDVGPVEAFAEDSITPFSLDGNEVIVIKDAGSFYVLPDRCTHARYPLNDGELTGDGKIRCIRHGATFDLETGRPTMPALIKIRLFEARVEDGRVLVSLQER